MGSRTTPRNRYRVEEGREIASLEDALQITSEQKVTRGDVIVYRGQSVFSWLLQPKVFRLARWYRHERDMIRELIATHPQEFHQDTLMLDRLVRMQHYGLPTRLLDVSQNFLASLFFACAHDKDKPDEAGAVFVISGRKSLRKYYDSDAISLVANLSNLSETEKQDLLDEAPNNAPEPEGDDFNRFPATDRLVQFVKDEKPYFRNRALRDDLLKTFLVIPKKNNRRIVAQSGAFLVFGLVPNDRSPSLAGFSITRHRVPKKHKDDLREALQGLGITSSTLFPEIDHAANFIAENFRSA